MKNFKYKHSALVLALLSVVSVITLIGLIFSIKSALFATFTNELVAFIALAIINLFLFVLAFSIILFSRYKLKNGKLKFRLGFIGWTINLSEIASLTQLIDTKKLIAFFADGNYIFIVIAPDMIDEFIKEAKKQCPPIVFDINYSEINNNIQKK